MSEHSTLFPAPEQAEEWRPVVRYEGVYEVSNLGRVKRIKEANATQVGRILKTRTDYNGYRGVFLSHQGRMFFFLHTVVAAAFLGPCPEGMEINHEDGDKGNNSSGNLRYVTRSENMKHAFRNGLANNRYRRMCKLTDDQVREIRALKGKVSQYVLAERFGIGQQMVSLIQAGKRMTLVV